MKKTLLKKASLALVLAGFASSVNALGIYGQLDLGYGSSSLENVGSKNMMVYRPTIGFNFGSNYIGLDWTNWGKKSRHSATSSATTKLDTIGFKYTYMLLDSLPIRPYVGARLNFTHLKMDTHTTGSTYNSKSGYRLGAGLFTGVEFSILPLLSIGVSGEWNKLYSDTNNYFFSGYVRINF